MKKRKDSSAKKMAKNEENLDKKVSIILRLVIASLIILILILSLLWMNGVSITGKAWFGEPERTIGITGAKSVGGSHTNAPRIDAETVSSGTKSIGDASLDISDISNIIIQDTNLDITEKTKYLAEIEKKYNEINTRYQEIKSLAEKNPSITSIQNNKKEAEEIIDVTKKAIIAGVTSAYYEDLNNQISTNDAYTKTDLELDMSEIIQDVEEKIEGKELTITYKQGEVVAKKNIRTPVKWEIEIEIKQEITQPFEVVLDKHQITRNLKIEKYGGSQVSAEYAEKSIQNTLGRKKSGPISLIFNEGAKTGKYLVTYQTPGPLVKKLEIDSLRKEIAFKVSSIDEDIDISYENVVFEIELEENMPKLESAYSIKLNSGIEMQSKITNKDNKYFLQMNLPSLSEQDGIIKIIRDAYLMDSSRNKIIGNVFKQTSLLDKEETNPKNNEFIRAFFSEEIDELRLFIRNDPEEESLGVEIYEEGTNEKIAELTKETLIDNDYNIIILPRKEGRVSVDVKIIGNNLLVNQISGTKREFVTPQCSDGIDNDNDGLIDYPSDPGCLSPDHDDESNPVTQCSDGIDNDGDGWIDLMDIGCRNSREGNNEYNLPMTNACADGIDNDNDGLIDGYDAGCSSPRGYTELTHCQDRIDNDNDGLIDSEDPSCWESYDPINKPYNPQKKYENESTSQCQDGIDNDNDGLIDLLDDDCEGNPLKYIESGTFGIKSDRDKDGIFDDGDSSAIIGDNLCKEGQTDNCDDNCLSVYNPEQIDSNNNGIGDACEYFSRGDSFTRSRNSGSNAGQDSKNTGTKYTIENFGGKFLTNSFAEMIVREGDVIGFATEKQEYQIEVNEIVNIEPIRITLSVHSGTTEVGSIFLGDLRTFNLGNEEKDFLTIKLDGVEESEEDKKGYITLALLPREESSQGVTNELINFLSDKSSKAIVLDEGPISSNINRRVIGIILVVILVITIAGYTIMRNIKKRRQQGL